MERSVFYQRKMTLLEDSHAGALYNYLISVQTGHRKNAGTTANVRLLLFSSCVTKASLLEIQAKISSEGWWIHHFCAVGEPEAEWLRGGEQHPYPHRPWEASLWERSCWLVSFGHPLPAGRGAKHQAAAWQHWRLPVMVGCCPRLDIPPKWALHPGLPEQSQIWVMCWLTSTGLVKQVCKQGDHTRPPDTAGVALPVRLLAERRPRRWHD